MIGFLLGLLFWVVCGFVVALVAVRPVTAVINAKIVLDEYDRSYRRARQEQARKTWSLFWLTAILVFWPLALFFAIFAVPVYFLNRKVDKVNQPPSSE